MNAFAPDGVFRYPISMPRADRISLTAGGLAMPPVAHFSNKGTLNVLLDRAFSGIPAGLPPDRTMFGLFMNFSRLTDKALREYDAARAEMLLYISPHDGILRTSPYLRAIDHMENCVSAAPRPDFPGGLVDVLQRRPDGQACAQVKELADALPGRPSDSAGEEGTILPGQAGHAQVDPGQFPGHLPVGGEVGLPAEPVVVDADSGWLGRVPSGAHARVPSPSIHRARTGSLPPLRMNAYTSS
jgi:hypothetical protein